MVSEPTLTAPSLYTYFSKSAIVAALQRDALEVLAQAAREAVDAWSASDGSDPHVVALGRLVAFDLTMRAPTEHLAGVRPSATPDGQPRPGGPTTRPAYSPAAFEALAVPAALIDQAVEARAVDATDPETMLGAADSSTVRAAPGRGGAQARWRS